MAEYLLKSSKVITYEYRGYFLEMSLVGEQSSIRVKGSIPTHSYITFYDEDISRMKSQFEAFVDRELEPFRDETWFPEE